MNDLVNPAGTIVDRNFFTDEWAVSPEERKACFSIDIGYVRPENQRADFKPLPRRDECELSALSL
jgi:hypothetical protein